MAHQVSEEYLYGENINSGLWVMDSQCGRINDKC